MCERYYTLSRSTIQILRIITKYIVNPSGFVIFIILLIPATIKYRNIDNVIIKNIVTILMIFFFIAVLFLIADFYGFFSAISSGFYNYLPKYWTVSALTFIWSLLNILLFLHIFQTQQLVFSQNKIFSNNIKSVINIFASSVNKYEKSALNKFDAENKLKNILSFIEKEKPYLDPDLTLIKLADKLHMPRNKLSQIINQYKKQNFYEFINSYRIEEAKILLTHSNPEHTNILHIAFESGFNSKSSFYNYFKKNTGMHPTEYLKKNNKNYV